MLVPEIALTPQTVRRFRARFDRVAVLHSGMTESERATRLAPHPRRRRRRGHRPAERRVRAGARARAARGRRGARGLLQAAERAALPRARRRHRAGAGRRAPWCVLGIGDAGARELAQRAGGPLRAARACPSASADAPCRPCRSSTCGAARSGPRKRRHLSRTLAVRIREALREERPGDPAPEPARLRHERRVPAVRLGPRVPRACDVSLTYHRSARVARSATSAATRRAAPATARTARSPRCACTASERRRWRRSSPRPSRTRRVARMDSDTMTHARAPTRRCSGASDGARSTSSSARR